MHIKREIVRFVIKQEHVNIVEKLIKHLRLVKEKISKPDNMMLIVIDKKIYWPTLLELLSPCSIPVYQYNQQNSRENNIDNTNLKADISQTKTESILNTNTEYSILMLKVKETELNKKRDACSATIISAGDKEKKLTLEIAKLRQEIITLESKLNNKNTK